MAHKKTTFEILCWLTGMHIHVKWLDIQILYHKTFNYFTIKHIKLIILWKIIKNSYT